MRKRNIIILILICLVCLGFSGRYSVIELLENIKFLQFDTTYTDGSYEGRMQWNTDDGVPEIGLPGGVVNLQIGQEMLDRAINDEGATINNGEVVFISGAAGNFSKVQTPIATNPNEAPRTYAVATEDILNNQKGYVTLIGKVRDINTSGGAESWVDGDIIYLSDSVEGGTTKIRPTPPDIGVIIGVVLRAHATEGVLGVNPVVIQRVSLSSDVIITNIQDGDVLTWNAASGVWINQAP